MKEVRDAMGVFPHVVESDNFVVKWGNAGSFSDEDAETLIGFFEIVWREEIDRMEFPTPLGADDYKFNVYVGDTGSPAPPSNGQAGYYSLDEEGLPFIVMNPGAVAQGNAGVTAAHEFFHAIQWGTGQYQVDADAAWYFEATAMWVEGEVFPGTPDESSFLYALAFAPQLPLWHIGGTDGTLSALHPYGAFIFVRYLTEHIGDWTWVRDSWTDARAAPSPQTTLGARLEDEGYDLATLYADYAAHNTVWDYAAHDDYVDNLDLHRDDAAADPDEDEVVGRLQGPGEIRSDDGPQGGGYEVGVLEEAEVASWRALFSGDAGVPWGVRMIEDTVDGPVYTEFVVTDGEGEVTFEGTGRDVWFSVAAWTPQSTTGRWTLTLVGPGSDTGNTDVTDVPHDTGQNDTGVPKGPDCGCSTPRGPAGIGLLAAAAALVTRRRR